MDLQLGRGIRGDEFAAEYRRRAKGPVRIVVVSGLDNAEALARSVGADATLAKPYDLDELIRTIHTVGAAQR
jgi:DNA-binding response OmpR family regulator